MYFTGLLWRLYKTMQVICLALWLAYAAAAAKLLQLCPTLCDPIDGSPPGSPVSGILQARILEWVAISFSNAWKWKVKVKSLSCVRLLATPWTAAHQAPPSMEFSRQECWSGVPYSERLKITLKNYHSSSLLPMLGRKHRIICSHFDYISLFFIHNISVVPFI